MSWDESIDVLSPLFLVVVSVQDSQWFDRKMRLDMKLTKNKAD